MICVVTYPEPAWDKKEIARYAGWRGDTDEAAPLIEDCIREAAPVLQYRAVCEILPIDRTDGLRFGNIVCHSKTLEKALCGCDRLVLLAATVGAGFDRLLQKYSVLSPARAVVLQGLGAERVESLCNTLCDDISASLCPERLAPRVSPGYGDIPMALQRDIFAALDCERKIGLTLTDGLLMTPSKSVTAIAGITENKSAHRTGCAACEKKDCAFRTEGTQ